MTRRMELESVILGTLLNSFGTTEFYDECKNLLTDRAFSTEMHREIYKLVDGMFKGGKRSVTPYAVCEHYGWKMPTEIVLAMVELSREWDFTSKMAEYNETVYLTDTSVHKHYSHARFTDYVSRLFSIA